MRQIDFGRGRIVARFFITRTIPADTFVYAARYVGHEPVTTIGGPIIVPLPESATVARGYAATHAIGQLVLQVLAFKRPKDLRESLNIRIPGRWTTFHKPVWPHPPGWSWPSVGVIRNLDELKLFATRVAEEFR